LRLVDLGDVFTQMFNRLLETGLQALGMVPGIAYVVGHGARG